jgi:dihydroorotate dehydrogenase electron transfer subunit
VRVFTFRDRRCARAVPGQFLMLWIPGVDEIPLSVLGGEGVDGLVSVAVKNVGEATQALHEMRVGDVVGVRGPFGRGFSSVGGRLLLVGGGTGMVPLLFLARKLVSKAVRIVFVAGAKTRDELLFLKELERLGDEKRMRVVVSTEDGSCGVTGLCTDVLEEVLAEETFDFVFACGPETMMLRVFELAEKRGLPFEASLERLMRCAIGLCGSCLVGRYRVCADGPVFSAEMLREVSGEFGVWKRDFDMKRVPV